MAKKTEKKIKDSLVKGAFLVLEELMTWVSKHGIDKDSKREELVEELGRMVQEFEPGDKVEDDVIETLKGLGISLPSFMDTMIEKDEKEPVVEEDEDEEDEDDEEEEKDEKPKKKKKPIEKEEVEVEEIEDDEEEDDDEDEDEDDDEEDENKEEIQSEKEKGNKVKKTAKKEKEIDNKKTKSISKVKTSSKRKDFIISLISKGKFTKKEIIKAVIEKFPETNIPTIDTELSHGKNPKYNKFEKLVVTNDKGFLSFK